MSDHLDPGALLARYYPLPRGPRVCLRLVRPRDQEGIRDLLRAHGSEPDELEMARLVGFDLRRRLVLCATALVDSAETVLGVGAIEFGAGASAEPTFVVVDERRTEGLDSLLRDALMGHAAALERARAA